MNTTSDLLIVPGTGVIIDPTNGNYILNITSASVLEKLTGTFPYLFTQPYENSTLVVLPVHEDTLRILRNLGLPTAGMEPFYFQYLTPMIEGEYKTMAHQVASAAFMSSHPRCFNTSTMRTGKTGSTVMATDYLQSVKKVPGATLVVATVSNLTGVWGKTITLTFPHKKVVVVTGSKAARLKKLRIPADYYIINYDGAKIVRDELIKMVDQGTINTVVLDELTHYGNTGSGRWQSMDCIINGTPVTDKKGRKQKPTRPADHVMALTGAPGENPLPIFGFVKLVNPSRLPCERLSTWQEMTQYRFGKESWMWRNKPETPDIIFRTMQPTIRFDKKDIMDLPPVVRQTRDCELTKEQAAAYTKMREEMVALTQSGELIEAVHKASLLHKLFQISLGSVVVGPDKKIIELDNEKRLNTIVEVIEEAEQKVVIFSPYTGVINRLVKQLRDKGYTVDKVDGSVTGKKRTEIFHRFQEEKDPHILICHPETTAFGVELAAADIMIFNGPPLSGGFIYEQALERLSSLKQKAKQITVVQLVATEEERKFFAGLDRGVKASELVSDLFASFTKGLLKAA